MNAASGLAERDDATWRADAEARIAQHRTAAAAWRVVHHDGSPKYVIGDNFSLGQTITLKLRAGLAAPIERVYRGKGCSNCHGSGYKGRVGLYEVLTLDDDLRDRIGSGASVLEIRKAVRQKGLRGIAHHSAERVQAGATSLEEILRVLGPQAGED